MKNVCNVNLKLHKTALVVLLTVLFITATPVVSRAEENDTTAAERRVDEALGDFFDSIPDEFGGVEDAEDVSEMLGIKRILSGILSVLKESSGELSVLLLSLLGTSLISALASLGGTELSLFASRGVGGVSAALLFDRLLFLVRESLGALSELNTFFGAVIPVSLAINSLGASPTTASTQAVGMGITLSAYSFVAEKMLGGIVGAIFITSALSSVDPILSRLSRSVKNIFLTLLGVLTILLSATFSLQSTISSSQDSVAMRSAKYAVSGTIPIVGNAVSGALGLVTGGVAYARSIVGGGAVAVVLSMVIAPLVTLFAYRLCLKLGVGFCSWCSLDGCGGVISSFLGALDTLIAVYALTAIIYIAELIAFLKGGVNIA